MPKKLIEIASEIVQAQVSFTIKADQASGLESMQIVE